MLGEEELPRIGGGEMLSGEKLVSVVGVFVGGARRRIIRVNLVGEA